MRNIFSQNKPFTFTNHLHLQTFTKKKLFQNPIILKYTVQLKMSFDTYKIHELIDSAIGMNNGCDFIVNFKSLNSLLHKLVNSVSLNTIDEFESSSEEDSTSVDVINESPEIINQQQQKIDVRKDDGEDDGEDNKDDGSKKAPKKDKIKYHPKRNTNSISRIESIEIGLGKVTNIIQDLAKGYKHCEKIANQYKTSGSAISEIKDKIDDIEKVLFDLGSLPDTYQIGYVNHTPSQGSNHTLSSDKISNNFNELSKSMETIGMNYTSTDKLDIELKEQRKELDEIKLKLQNLYGDNDQLEYIKETNANNPQDTNQQKRDDRKLKAFEAKISIFEKSFQDIAQKLDYVENDILEMKKLIPTAEQVEQNSNLTLKVQQLEEFIDEISQKISAITMSNQKLENELNSLNDRNEVLASVKIDKDDVEFSLALKADNLTLSQKVSNEKFEAFRSEFDGTITKLTTINEQINDKVASMFADINNRLENNASHHEVKGLQKYISSMYETLQTRLECLAKIQRQENEAAGTNTKYLRNLDCISCNHNALMKTREEGQPIRNGALPSSLKQPTRKQREIATAEDMLMNKNAYQSETRSKKCDTLETTDQRFCSRYCGGSHTIIPVLDRMTNKQNNGAQKTNIEIGHCHNLVNDNYYDHDNNPFSQNFICTPLTVNNFLLNPCYQIQTTNDECK